MAIKDETSCSGTIASDICMRVMRRTPDAIDTARDGPGTPIDKLSHPSLDTPTPNFE